MEPRSAFVAEVNDEAGVARWLWAKFKKHAAFSQYDPFVVALAAGTLKRESFLNFIEQDAYFLKKYAEACKLVEGCADSDDDIRLINEIQKDVEEELINVQNNKYISKIQKDAEEEHNLHNSVPKAWDDEFAKECSPNMATVEYTRFLLATAAGKVEEGEEPSGSVNLVERKEIPAYAIGAMIPCSRLYAFLGQEIMKALEHDISDHSYRQWIERYSSENSEASATGMETFLDKLANLLTGEKLEVLGRLYYHALKLEREFFAAQPLYQKTLVPLLKLIDSANCRYTIISDFELSCTALDSLSIVSEIAILTTLKAEQNSAENLTDRKLSLDLRNTWEALSSQSSEEYEECLVKILPPEQMNTFDYEGIYKSLERLSQFEIEANFKVVESGVLQSLDIDDIKKAGEHIAFQDGCVDFFKQILKKLGSSNVDVHILSVCLSGDLIRAAILSRDLDGIHIHSNRLTFAESISTGGIDWRVELPIDKLKIFKKSLVSAKENDMEHISIFIGDSLGDLLCLIQADIGIVIGTNSTLRWVGKHFGVSFVPLFSGVLKKERAYQESSSYWTKESGIVYTVSSWSEVHAFLLGFSN